MQKYQTGGLGFRGSERGKEEDEESDFFLMYPRCLIIVEETDPVDW